MHATFWTAVTLGVAVGALSGCGEGRPVADPAVGPTLSLAGASGVSAEITREVSVRAAAGAETLVSAVDTAVWAPFNADGAALASSDGAGTPGPLGLRASAPAADLSGGHYRSFRDSAGVLHELRVHADAPGPWTRIEYRRGGMPVLEQTATWTAVADGWIMADASVTYRLTDGRDLRVALRGRQLTVAGTEPHPGPLVSAGAWFVDLLAPRPLAAQFFFAECTGDWLKWIGAALLTELAWGKFIQSKSPSDFKKAVAATTAAGVALNGLVDCMIEQPEEPDPGN